MGFSQADLLKAMQTHLQTLGKESPSEKKRTEERGDNNGVRIVSHSNIREKEH